MLLTTLEKPEFYSKKEWCSNRLKLIMLWQAIGRTGEVALSSWNDAHWNEQIDNLQSVWKDVKTSKEYCMTFFGDQCSFAMNFYHAVGCYFAMGGGCDHYKGDMDRSMDWVFPDLAAVSDQSKPICDIFNALRPFCRDMDDATRTKSDMNIIYLI